MGNASSAQDAHGDVSISPRQPVTSEKALETNVDWDCSENENASPNVDKIDLKKEKNHNSPRFLKVSPPNSHATTKGQEPREKDDDDLSTTSALMEASAAVFHYLNIDMEDNQSSLDDDISVVDMPAAVFDHLQYEAKAGNEKPLRQFFQTAKVVSDVLLQEKYDHSPRNGPIKYDLENDDDSTNRQRAAIYRALYRTNKGKDDRNPPSRQPPSHLQLRQNDDAESIVSEMSHSIFKILNETKERIDENNARDFSATVANILVDSQQEAERKKQNEDGLISPPEHSTQIFKVIKAKMADSQLSSSDAETYVSHLKPRKDPKQIMERNIFHLLAQRQNQPIETIRETDVIGETEEVEDENEDDDTEEDNSNCDGEVASTQSPHPPASETPLPLQIPPRQDRLDAIDRAIAETKQSLNKATEEIKKIETLPKSIPELMEPIELLSEESHSESSEQEIQDEIDLVFVERFDEVFDDFIGRHPKFLLTNPDLVQHLRINKLQRLLDHMDDIESKLLTHLSSMLGEKHTMESQLSTALKEASRKKANYQVSLQSELRALDQRKSFKEAQMTWKLVHKSEAKAKKQFIYEQSMKRKRQNFFNDNLSGVPSREELLQLLPSDAEGYNLRSAISAIPRYFAADSDQVGEMRTYQVQNAFLISETTMLNKKLSQLDSQSKRLAWVNTILQRMDNVQMANLKKKFSNKLGVVSLD